MFALVPLKDPSRGKARLMEVLSAGQRAELIRVMLDHVASTLASSPSIREVSVLTGENTPVPQGCKRLPDRDFELNAAVVHAVRELRALGKRGMVLVVHADLPFVTREDIDALVAACQREAVVAAPDWTGTGTNALAFPLTGEVTPRYGPDSLAAHRESARAAGLPFVLVRRAGLAEDIDQASQLKWLLERAGERYAFLAARADGGRHQEPF